MIPDELIMLCCKGSRKVDAWLSGFSYFTCMNILEPLHSLMSCSQPFLQNVHPLLFLFNFPMFTLKLYFTRWIVINPKPYSIQIISCQLLWKRTFLLYISIAGEGYRARTFWSSRLVMQVIMVILVLVPKDCQKSYSTTITTHVNYYENGHLFCISTTWLLGILGPEHSGLWVQGWSVILGRYWKWYTIQEISKSFNDPGWANKAVL